MTSLRLLASLLALIVLASACASSRHAFEPCDDAHPCEAPLQCLPTGNYGGLMGGYECTVPCSEGCAMLHVTYPTSCYSGELMNPADPGYVPTLTPICQITCDAPVCGTGWYSPDHASCWCF